MNSQNSQVENSSTEIHQPREYFAAAVLFASRISQIANIPLLDAIDQYTGLYREVTGREGLEGGIDPLWLALVAQIDEAWEPDAITQLLYDAYLQQPHSIYNPSTNSLHAKVIGALGYVYNASDHTARLHFFPKRSSVSALSSKHFQERRVDFRQLLLDIRAEHPDAARIKSSTWLQNLPNYRNLFPPAFQTRLQNIGPSTYLGIWGQFVKGDGSGNQERLAQFQAALLQANTLDEAIAAFPFPVLEAIGPIQEFYEEYGL